MTEYWWDGSGDDPELGELERHLHRLSFRETRAPGVPQLRSDEPPARRRRLAAWYRSAFGVVVAAACLLLGLALWSARARRAGWEVIALHGAPRIGLTTIEGRGRWQPGETLETSAGGRAKILVDDIGQVDVEPSTRLRLVSVQPGVRRLALDHGMIRAFIKAPPRQFLVETPGAVAADLGCAYSVQVGADGEGLLRVSFGWVAFESQEREVYVPAGAACALHPRTGPGTPYFEDASEPFRSALRQLDGVVGAVEERRPAFETLLQEARARDVLTLLQMLQRITPDERARVCERAAMLLPPPPGVRLEAVADGDAVAYDLWWRQLGLGDMKWWRIGRDH